MTYKQDLSERDICTKYIQSTLEKAVWNPLIQIREEVTFTYGRIYVKDNLTSWGKRKRADYILYYKPNIPIAIIEELTEQGIIFENLKEAIIKEMDVFDLICHTAFDQPSLTRTEKVKNVKKSDYFTQYGDQARKVLNQFGSPLEIVGLLRGKSIIYRHLMNLRKKFIKGWRDDFIYTN